MRASVSDDVALAIANTAFTVASAGDTLPLSAADRAAIPLALQTVFGYGDRVDVDKLQVVGSVDLVRIIEDPAVRLDLTRVLAVLALLDGAVEQTKLQLVLDVASARGRGMRVNVYDGHWDFWAHATVPLEEMRDRYTIAPLDPQYAAVGDEHARRSDFERPGVPPPPPISSVPITDHPPLGPPRDTS